MSKEARENLKRDFDKDTAIDFLCDRIDQLILENKKKDDVILRYANKDNWMWSEDDQHPYGYWSQFIDDEGYEGPELAISIL